MVEQVLNNDLMSRSSSLHQGSKTRPRLPVGEGNIIKDPCLMERCSSLGTNEDAHLTLALALLSSRNLTNCWWPVLVQWNRAVQP